MCYKRPGPRCSKRARIKLQNAKRRAEHALANPSLSEEVKLHLVNQYQHALRQYEMTPEGLDTLEQEIARVKAQISDGAGDHRELYDLHKRLIVARESRASGIRAAKEQHGRNAKKGHSPTSTALFAIYDDDFDKQSPVAEALIKEHTALYGEPIGQGRTRVVYDRGDGTVVKVPLSWQGCRDNWQEAGWDAEETGIPIARCYTQEVDGIPLLVMEKVTPITDQEEMPLWASRVDCYQVGINSAGYAVAYDL